MLVEEARTRRARPAEQEQPDVPTWRWIALGAVLGGLAVYLYQVL